MVLGSRQRSADLIDNIGALENVLGYSEDQALQHVPQSQQNSKPSTDRGPPYVLLHVTE